MTKTKIINLCIYFFGLYYSITFSGSQNVILLGKTIDWFPREIEMKAPFSRTMTYLLKYSLKDIKHNPNAIPLKLTIISLF